jgi:hypothetical protein
MLSKEHGVPGWWCQMVTVEYERARGLRAPHQPATGFSVGVSKAIAVSLSDLYAATAHATKRKKWFPRGVLESSSKTTDKYFRGSWNGHARLEFYFYAKDSGRTQVAVQVSRLAEKTDVERERSAWKAALEKLAELVTSRRAKRQT